MTHDPELAALAARLQTALQDYRALTPYQQRTLARAQARIRADIEQGIVPPTVRGFEHLHDFVDANEYLLDDAGDFDAELEGLSVDEITREVMGPVVDALDVWLQSGRKHNGRGLAAATEKRAPNTVFMDVRAREGWRIAVLTAPHDGTRAGIVAAADRLQQRALARFSDHTHAGSRLFATDATGALGWVISPNLAHVSRYDAPEAREMLGLPKRNGAAQPLPYAQRLRAWETAWAAYQASDQGNDAWEALEFACRFIGERNPIPPPPAFHWHRRPAGPARGPCPVCGCGDARMKAEHRRVPGKGCEKMTKVCFGADCNIERIPGPRRERAPKRNSAPGHGERVMAYWNLHKGQWSLKSLATGRVIARVPHVTLTNATFRVSEAGRQRVLREGVKNVHAGVVGVVGEGPRDGQHIAVRYNPRTGAHFTDRDSGRALVGAQTVSLNADRSVTAWRPSYLP